MLSCLFTHAADFQWPSSKRVSPECKDIVAKILVVDASKRISIQEIQVRSLRAITIPALQRA